jgi:hypothetical protein
VSALRSPFSRGHFSKHVSILKVTFYYNVSLSSMISRGSKICYTSSCGRFNTRFASFLTCCEQSTHSLCNIHVFYRKYSNLHSNSSLLHCNVIWFNIICKIHNRLNRTFSIYIHLHIYHVYNMIKTSCIFTWTKACLTQPHYSNSILHEICRI